MDPTGVGDAFRAGFVAALSWGVSPERCAQVGSVLGVTAERARQIEAGALGKLRALLTSSISPPEPS